MNRGVLISCAALVALPLGGTRLRAAEGATTYEVAMSADQEAPAPGPAGATGSVVLALDPAAGTVCYSALTYDGPGKANAGHIHKAAKGLAGPVVVNFGEIQVGKDGCVTTAAETIEKIIADPGGHYVNVHTPEYAAGAVRGQLAGG